MQLFNSLHNSPSSRIWLGFTGRWGLSATTTGLAATGATTAAGGVELKKQRKS
jgi:hypothetical protein